MSEAGSTAGGSKELTSAETSNSALQFQPPYDRLDGDVVLCSSDRVGFKTHRLLLAMASPVFGDMFSLPQPSTASDEQQDFQAKVPLPIVEVTEDSKTLRALLDTCYPLQNPDLSSLDAVDATLDAAVKYDVAKALDLCKRELQGFIIREPLRVFAIACRLDFETLAQSAADQARKQSIFRHGLKYAKELDRVSGGCYHRLLQHYRQRGTPPFGSPPGIPLDKGLGTPPSPSSVGCIQVASSPFDSLVANCIITASDGVAFHTDIAFISSAAPSLAARLVPMAGNSNLHIDLTRELDGISMVKLRQAVVEEDSQHCCYYFNCATLRARPAYRCWIWAPLLVWSTQHGST